MKLELETDKMKFNYFLIVKYTRQKLLLKYAFN